MLEKPFNKETSSLESKNRSSKTIINFVYLKEFLAE